MNEVKSRQSEKQKFARLYNLAQQGEKEAQFEVGECFTNGWGTQVNKVRALHWYYSAANKGQAKAINTLGLFYATGWWVAKNEKEAARLYKQAADKGLKEAQYNLAECYEHGRGVKKDHKEAMNWYTKAATQKWPAAEFKLLGKDKDKAVEFLTSCSSDSKQHLLSIPWIGEEICNFAQKFEASEDLKKAIMLYSLIKKYAPRNDPDYCAWIWAKAALQEIADSQPKISLPPPSLQSIPDRTSCFFPFLQSFLDRAPCLSRSRPAPLPSDSSSSSREYGEQNLDESKTFKI